MKLIVLNGWAASPRAWDLCGSVSGVRIFSYVEQLDGLARREFDQCDGAVLVGWSMGGSTALRLAASDPSKVKGLVLIAATPRMMEEKSSGWRGMSGRRLEALRKGLEMTNAGGFFGVDPSKPNPYMMDTPENLSRGLRYLQETDLREDVRGLSRVFAQNDVPVAIFQSEKDGIVRSSNALFLKEAFPRAELVMVPGAEHALTIEIPGAIDEAVLRMTAGAEEKREGK